MPSGVKRVSSPRGEQGQSDQGKVLSLESKESRFLSSMSALVSRLEAFTGRGFSTYKGARDLFTTLGYASSTSIGDHRERYRRGGIAKRVIDFYPREIWAGGFEVYDDDNPKTITTFESSLTSIFKRIPIVKQFKRADKLARLGQYSVLLIGVADNKPLDQEMGKLNNPDQVSYLTPYAEDRAEVIELVRGDEERSNPRFGLPLYYNIKHNNGDNRLGSKLYVPNVKVHWSRVIHITTDPLEDDLKSIPQLDPIWNLLDDLYKIVGGGSEAAWNQATQILHAKLDPNMEFEDESLEELDDKMKEVSHKLRRMLMTQGVDINALSTQVDKFAANGDFIIDLICATQSIQKRIFLGSERGELASTQDRQNKIDTISAMRLDYAEPTCVRQFVDRLITYSTFLKPRNGEYFVSWTTEEKLSEKEKAEAAKLRAEANKAQIESEGKLITTSDEIRDDIYGKEPLEVEEEEAIEETVEEPDTSEDVTVNVNLSVSRNEINNIQKVVKRNLNSFSSLVIEHFQSLDFNLEDVNSTDLREDDFIESTSSKILSVMSEAAKPAAKVVKSRVQTRFSAISIKLDITNPRAVEFAQSRSGELIKEIGPETLKGVRELIASSIEDGIPVNKISQSIRDSVGLRSDQVQAVNNLRDELRAAQPGSLITRFPADGVNRDLPGLRIKVPKNGFTEDQIKAKTDKYAQMQLNYRGRLIGRTELSRSANEGQRELWRQSIENGYLPEDIKRIWIANTDRHGDMDGQEVGINDPFDPPIEPGEEPNCGCSQGLSDSESVDKKTDQPEDDEVSSSDISTEVEKGLNKIDDSEISELEQKIKESQDKEDELADKIVEAMDSGAPQSEIDELNKESQRLTEETLQAREELAKAEEAYREESREYIHSLVEVDKDKITDDFILSKYDPESEKGAIWLRDHMARPLGADTEVNITRGEVERSNFVDKTATINLEKGADARIFVHEMGHRFELLDPDLKQKSLDYLESRTKGETPISLADLGRGHSKKEIALADEFFNPYVGRVYQNGRATEILSMGLEHFYADPATLYREDPGLFNYVVEFLQGKW